MTNIVISGANGKMGKVINNVISLRDDCRVIAGIDINTEVGTRYKLYGSNGFFALGEVRDFESGRAVKPIKQFVI